MTHSPSIELTPEEVSALSGGYVQPAAQLKALHSLGYWRAHRSRLTGRVVVERAHYEAVAAGATAPDPRSKGAHYGPGPKLRAA